MFGLGKHRTRFGKWLDRNGITQKDVAKKAKVGGTTISNMCKDDDYTPKISTWVKVQRALKSMGHDVNRSDFFDI